MLEHVAQMRLDRVDAQVHLERDLAVGRGGREPPAYIGRQRAIRTCRWTGVSDGPAADAPPHGRLGLVVGRIAQREHGLSDADPVAVDAAGGDR